MNYKETLEFLYSKLPMYQNLGKVAYKKDLTNTLKLLDYLGNPHKDKKWIHIGGTNGKGSVSSTLASIFIENGYSTGLYTSPHLVDFRERIQTNGQLIEKDFVIEFTQKVQPILDEIQPSFFELTVAMAFDYFRYKNIEIGIIEVGLGGRLDSTNVITPILSTITNVSWDHMDMLGNTLTKIAFEKGGIIKHKIPIVIGPMDEEAKIELVRQAALQKSSLLDASLIAVPESWSNHFSLKGIYQRENLKTIFVMYQYLKTIYKLNCENSLKGISKIKENSGLRGRWEVFSENPYIVADTAHNYPGVEQTMHQLISLNIHGELHIVWGMVSDKDRSKILSLLPKSAKYYFCKPSVIRGLNAEDLAYDAKDFMLQGATYNTVSEAIIAAKSQLNSGDVLYIGGSTFVVADALLILE